MTNFQSCISIVIPVIATFAFCQQIITCNPALLNLKVFINYVVHLLFDDISSVARAPLMLILCHLWFQNLSQHFDSCCLTQHINSNIDLHGYTLDFLIACCITNQFESQWPCVGNMNKPGGGTNPQIIMPIFDDKYT